MRYTWPSWVAIGLGALGLLLGLELLASTWDGMDPTGFMLGLYLLLPGAVLLAAGLHALQSAWSACGDCGDCCGYGGCDCSHCEGCRGDDCCGQCACTNVHGMHGTIPPPPPMQPH